MPLGVVGQIPGAISDVGWRMQEVREARELVPVVLQVDLHATHVDRLDAFGKVCLDDAGHIVEA